MPRKRTLSQAEEDSLNCALREPGISQSKAFKVWSVATGLSGLSRGVAQRLDESRLRPYQDLFAHGQCRALKPDKSSVSVHVLKVHRALQKMVKESNAWHVEMLRALRTSSVLRPVLYLDEVHAGNVLSAHAILKVSIYLLHILRGNAALLAQ